MKRTLWIASSVAVLALPVGAVASRSIAGGPTNLGSLQQAIGSKSVVDLTATPRVVCRKDLKTGNNCGPDYLGAKCHCP